MLEVIISKTGKKTALCCSKYIHSGIDPVREAEKYLLARFNPSDPPGVILLIFPGLNYLYGQIRKHFPDSRIIILHLNRELYENSVVEKYKKNDALWYPECGIPLKAFLYDNIYETDIKSLATISWEPVIKAFPEQAKTISSMAAQVLTEYNSNINTTSYFGKKSIKNIIRNITSLENIVSIRKIQKPLVITGSGPSLEQSIPLLRKANTNIFLVALSSSCSILEHYGVRPDIILTTDPGYYASVHLDYSVDKEIVLSSPLSANLGKSYKNPFLLINQGTFLEEYFLGSMGLPFLKLDPNGTVAGSALFLASQITDMPVIMTGIDFCSDDIKTHCMPHSFERFINSNTCRYNPLLDRYYNQAIYNYPDKLSEDSNCRISGQLSAYTGWFNSTYFKSSCYRLNPSPVSLDSLKPINNEDAFKLIDTFSNAGEKTLNNSGLADSKKYFSSTAVDKKNYRKLIYNLQDNLLAELENRFKYISSDAIRTELKTSFDKDILYYFDTYKYLDLFHIMNKNMSTDLKEKYTALNKECILFLEKEFAKTRVCNE